MKIFNIILVMSLILQQKRGKYLIRYQSHFCANEALLQEIYKNKIDHD